MMSMKRLSFSLKKKKQSDPDEVTQDRELDKGQSRWKHVMPLEMHKRRSIEDEVLKLYTRPSTACVKTSLTSVLFVVLIFLPFHLNNQFL